MRTFVESSIKKWLVCSPNDKIDILDKGIPKHLTDELVSSLDDMDLLEAYVQMCNLIDE